MAFGEKGDYGPYGKGNEGYINWQNNQEWAKGGRSSVECAGCLTNFLTIVLGIGLMLGFLWLLAWFMS